MTERPRCFPSPHKEKTPPCCSGNVLVTSASPDYDGTAGQVRKLAVKQMDHGDGTFSGQYYFNVAAARLDVSVTVGGAHVAGSPYRLEHSTGHIPTEKCKCPRKGARFEAGGAPNELLLTLK